MKLFETFAKKAPNKVFISITLGALAGISYTALIPLVLTSISGQDPNFPELVAKTEKVLSIEVAQYEIALLFFFVCLFILFTRTISEVILIRVATLISKDFRVQFYKQISEAPISAIEKIGSSKLIASINLDVPRVVMGARIFPGLLVNAVSLTGMMGFLLYLNTEVFKLVMGAIFFGILSYQIPMVFGRRIFMKARLVRDDLQEAIRGLVYGAKELKLNKEKRNSFFNDVLEKHENDILRNEKKGHTIVYATTGFGELLSFFVIGLVSFVFLNYHAITQEELVGVIMALLYVTGPIGVLLNAIPQITIALVSVRKVNQLLKEIPKEEVSNEIVKVPGWDSIKFKNVGYSYDSQDDEKGFQIGPINFEINRGSINFIVGANGSGKSTLSKLITLHYLPDSGNICFGEQEVTAELVSSYRQQICAIYSDYFLFDRLLGEISDEVSETAREYLKQLHLADKVTLENGKFSTISLSDGQRKRLALLVAFLEDKSIYLFDEWAADQDPVFKDIFYTKILPELKAKGKAIIVISHDDRYFNVADNILVMEQGEMKSKTHSEPLASASITEAAECI